MRPIEQRAVWQVSGTAAGRSYADVFLQYGVALVGPGDPGSWEPTRYERSQGRMLSRFAEDARADDIVLLRTGQSTICAVGVIAGEYEYLPQFDDVNGFDLQHARRVRWYRLPKEHITQDPAFSGSTPAFSEVTTASLVDFTCRFVRSEPIEWQFKSLPRLPVEEPYLDDPPERLRMLVGQAQDLASLYAQSEVFGDSPSESELVAHFVVPFLRALEWRPEEIALEWQRIDVAVFDRIPRRPDTCRYIIEAKRIGADVERALRQAREYVDAIGVSLDIVITDGIRYRYYSAERGYAATSYANLVRLKASANALFEAMRR